MANNPLIFKDAEAVKNAIMDSQKKEIAKLYENWADEIGERAKYFSHKATASSVVSERQMKELQKQLRATSQEVSNEIYSKIKNNIYTVSDAVVADNVNWLKSFGFSKDGLNAAFTYVPDDVVRNLITGQIYDSGWSLSSRIWSDNEDTLKDIYKVMAKGLAENKPIYEIAKDLESYVRPSARLPWNIKASDGVKIFKKQVDYNAQRLARTLVQHGYQQSFVATTQKNPFIIEYVWISNGSRVCPLCSDRDGQHYKKDALPLDHPNGMCTMEPVIADDMVDQLANWFNSPDGTYPEIDEFASNFGYEVQKTGTVQDFINKYGTSTKNPSAWYHSMTPIQKAEAKVLKDASGLGWDDFYEKYIYSGSTDDIAAYKAKVAAKKTAKKAIKVDNAYETQLKKIGFTDSQMPKNYNSFIDWYFKDDISYNSFKKLSKELTGLDNIDVNALENFFDKVTANKASKTVTKVMENKAPKTVAKTTAKKVASKTDDAFDMIKWSDSLSKNNLNEMNKWTDDWLKVISKTEINGVTKYTSSAYEDMNMYLRGQYPTTRYDDEIKACRSALSKASLPKETIVRRGSDYNMLNELEVGNVTPENKSNFIGSIVEDKGFTSTSPAPSGGFSGKIEYIIKLPQGSQAMYIDKISKYQGEEELLINCGGKFIVENIDFNNYGEVEKIYMTLVNLQ